MGFFKKKSDPISERARALNLEIAALETEIKKLNAKQAQTQSPANGLPQPPPASPAPAPAPPQSPQPRLRSTALPHHRNVVTAQPAPPAANHEPVFEVLDQKRIQSSLDAAPPKNDHELDVRKNDFGAIWRRLKNHFRGPPTSNPKLVNYLAAGSIQGLRPLRYERRVARNRFIALLLFLVLVLWGLIAAFIKHR